MENHFGKLKSMYSIYFGQNILEYIAMKAQHSATFYNKEEAETWYNYYVNKKSVREIKVIAQNK